MSVFVDTSALLAVLDADDSHHVAASARWTELLEADERLDTTNYVLVETHALVQSRLGMTAVRTLIDDIVPALHVHWIGEDEHATSVAALLTASRRLLSLVDCASFEVMRRRGLGRVFAYDRHFGEQGFEVLR